MREIIGNLWDYYAKPGYIVCITTNGTVKRNGECVMGRGCALEAVKAFPGIALALGAKIKAFGNVVQELRPNQLWAFPVKHEWFEQADIKLIEKSAQTLACIAQRTTATFILPRPGCGNGRLTWEQVGPLLTTLLPDNVWVISNA